MKECARMTATRTKEDLIISGCGLITSLVTGLQLWLIEDQTGLALHRFMCWLIVPVGAAVAGFLAASGYYLGSKYLDHRPSAMMLANSVLASLSTFYLIHYLSYRSLSIDGVAVQSIIPFTTYVDL